jgi:transcriptional regulator with XRE-family HTH domain
MSLRNGRQLKAARALAGLSQRQLAHQAGLHVNSVKGWETRHDRIGGFAVSRMIAALEAYGITFSEEASNNRLVGVLKG